MKSGILSKLLAFFAATQLLGIYIASRHFAQEPNLIEAQSLSDFGMLDVLLVVFFLTLITFIATKYQKFAGLLFSVFLFMFVYAGMQSFAEVWVTPGFAFIIAIVFASIIRLYKNILFQNIGMVVALAGIGAIMGLALEPITVVIFLVVLSFYDIFAVYKTGHMVKMAESMVKSKNIFGFVVPEETKHLHAQLQNVKIGAGSGFMILGSGDIILPLILAASLVRQSVLDAYVVALFSIAGVAMMYYLFSNQRRHHAMAALPPIAMASIIGYLVTQLAIL